MTPEQKAAFVMAQAACAMARIAAMQAENQHRIYRGEALAYTEQAFMAVIDDTCIGHDEVILLFNADDIETDNERG